MKPEEFGEALLNEVFETANAALEAHDQMFPAPAPSEGEDLAFKAGVAAGYYAGLTVLERHGLLTVDR